MVDQNLAASRGDYKPPTLGSRSALVIDHDGPVRRHKLLVKLADRQGWRCCWCGRPTSPHLGRANTATIEHIDPPDGYRRRANGKPRARHPLRDAECAMACRRCNHLRGRRSPEEFTAWLEGKHERGKFTRLKLATLADVWPTPTKNRSAEPRYEVMRPPPS